MRMLDNTAAMPEKTMKDTLRGVFGVNVSTFVIAAVCMLFMATAVLAPSKTGASLYEVIVNSITLYAVTMALNYIFKDKAIRDASGQKLVKDAETEVEKKVERIIENDETDDLDEWCREKNAQNYKMERSRILASAGLKYTECFEEDGTPKDVKIIIPSLRDLPSLGLREWLSARRIGKKQIKAMLRAQYLRLAELSSGELTGVGNTHDRYRLGRAIPIYKKQTTNKTAISKLITSVVAGYYCADVIANFSATNLLMKVLQISFALTMGAVEYISTTGYVLNELRGRYIEIDRILTRYFNRKGADTYREEVPRQLGHPDHESPGTGTTDRELHTLAG